MKTLAVLATLMLAATSAAAGTKTVLYPEKYCDKILSQEYSTGGGDTMWQMVEILCEDKDGNYRGFVATWGSAAGVFGLGRIASVEQFIYKPYSGETLVVE